MGALLLGGCRVSGEFHTDRILDLLLEDHLPATIERRREKLSREAELHSKEALALAGLEKSLGRGRMEGSLFQSTQRALSGDAGASVILPAPQLAANNVAMPLQLLKA